MDGNTHLNRQQQHRQGIHLPPPSRLSSYPRGYTDRPYAPEPSQFPPPLSGSYSQPHQPQPVMGHTGTQSSQNQWNPQLPQLPSVPSRTPTSSARQPSVRQEAKAKQARQAFPKHEESSPPRQSLPLQAKDKRPLPDRDLDDGLPPTSDFVKKLFKMLEDNTDEDVVSWGPGGDNFVVKDMTEFTKSILPRMFKHSNFASFVRQLNKYDFHKIKSNEDGSHEQSWTFRHPDFQANNREALENIKRKVPTTRKSGATMTGAKPSPSPVALGLSASASTDSSRTVLPSLSATQPLPTSPELAPLGSSNPLLQAQIMELRDTFAHRMASLEAKFDELLRRYEDQRRANEDLQRRHDGVLGNMMELQSNLTQQDGVLRHLLGYFVGGQQSKGMPQGGPQTQQQTDQYAFTSPFVPSEEAQKMLMSSYTEQDLARVSLEQMNEMSKRAQVAGMTFAPVVPQLSMTNGRDREAGVNLSVNEPQTGFVGISPDDAMQPVSEISSLRTTASFDMNGNANTTFSTPGLSQPASAGPSSGSSVIGVGSPAQRTSYILPYGDPSLAEYHPGRALDASGTDADVHAGLSVLTVGHLVPRPFGDPPSNPIVGDPNSGEPHWQYAPNHLQGNNANSLQRVQSPPMRTPASPPSLSATDPRQLVTLDETYPIQPPPPPAVPRRSLSESPPMTPGSAAAAARQRLRVRRSTFVPGWAVPPRVLLVEDDIVSRRLSSKFLQVSGCTIDVAVDGVGAVNKMNLEKYDLVLMDIVMPKLDGISATNLIRKFDHMTPIISMTSNSKPSEILTYISNGMNDILPKPFTRAGLMGILEKHLMHLKQIRRMTTRIPRSLGESDNSLSSALTLPVSTPSSPVSTASALPPTTGVGQNPSDRSGPNGISGPGSGGSTSTMSVTTTNFSHISSAEMHDHQMGQINPLAGLGLSVEQYPTMLQNLLGMTGDALDGMDFDVGMGDEAGVGSVGTEMIPDMGLAGGPGFKRGREEEMGPPPAKRSRFEVVE